MCYGRSKARMVRWITSFLKQYKKRTGRHAVIYTTRGWWEACTGNSTKFAKTNPLFIARWQSSTRHPPRRLEEVGLLAIHRSAHRPGHVQRQPDRVASPGQRDLTPAGRRGGGPARA